MRQYVSIVRLLHVEVGYRDPNQSHYIISLFKGAKWVLGDTAAPKLPITPDILKSFFTHLDFRNTRDITFWAACLVAFFTFFTFGSQICLFTHWQSSNPLNISLQNPYPSILKEWFWPSLGQRLSNFDNAPYTFPSLAFQGPSYVWHRLYFCPRRWPQLHNIPTLYLHTSPIEGWLHSHMQASFHASSNVCSSQVFLLLDIQAIVSVEGVQHLHSSVA